MSKKGRQDRGRPKESRSVFLSFEFQKDASRRGAFISQAKTKCDITLIDNSLPAAEHGREWRREVKKSIQASDVVIALLGPDTQNAPGVKDELSLAGKAGCPVIQLMPQDCNYGLIAKEGIVCQYKWSSVNKMLRNPKGYAHRAPSRRTDGSSF